MVFPFRAKLIQGIFKFIDTKLDSLFLSWSFHAYKSTLKRINSLLGLAYVDSLMVFTEPLYHTELNPTEFAHYSSNILEMFLKYVIVKLQNLLSDIHTHEYLYNKWILTLYFYRTKDISSSN